ncbi:type II secretion system F family protein [Lactobacillaceae bacterium Scapto_B20]
MAKRLSIKVQSSFLESLNSLLNNGFSIKEAMNLMEQLQTNQLFITAILEQLKTGHSFAQSIDGYFAPNVVNQIQIAEQHGQLKLTLKEVQRFILAQAKYQNKIRALLTYPIVLILLLMILIIGINTFVTPQLNAIGTSHSKTTMFNWWWLPCSAMIIGCGLVCLWYRQQPKLQQIELLARLPIIGKLIQKYYAYYLASNISLLLSSGLEAKSIANLLRRFPINSVFYVLGNELASIIQIQGAIKQLIEQHGFIPNEAALFFGHGDSSIVIAKKLNAYAKMAFDQMWMLSQRMIATIQPIIFILIGGIIVTTYLQMLLPMYDTLSEVYN